MSKRKVWVTKYALTEGIKQCSVNDDDGGNYVYVAFPGYRSGLGLQCRRDLDYFDTEAQAKARAVEMVNAKLKSIAKSKSKMEDLLRVFHSKAGA